MGSTARRRGIDSRQALQAAAELTGILALWLLVVLLGARIALHCDAAAEYILVGAALVLGYFAADFLSGVVHWAGDRLGDESLPVIGAAVIKPFREHHHDQKAITRHGFLETNGNNSIVSLPMLLVPWLCLAEPGPFGLFVSASTASLAVFGFLTNQLHKWAHADHVPGPVRRLQSWGVVLSPERHALHHQAPHDRHYCITSGALSEPLDRIGFFRALDSLNAHTRLVTIPRATRRTQRG